MGNMCEYSRMYCTLLRDALEISIENPRYF